MGGYFIQQQRFRSNLITFVLLGLIFVLSFVLVQEDEGEVIVFEDTELPKLILPKNDEDEEAKKEEEDLTPHFMIIGVVRGGTTSFVRTLEVNPKVCAAVEPNFWNVYQKFSKGYEWYLDEYFPHCNKWPSKPKFTVDKTSSYIYHPQTSARIRRTLPSTKFVTLLRNPVERLHSQYYNDVCRFYTNQTFEDYIESNPKVVELGFYDRQLKHWFDLFPLSQFLFLRSEDYFSSPLQTLETTQDWLELPRYPYTSSHGTSSKLMTIRYGAHCRKDERGPEIGEVTRRKLEELYRPSVLELERMTKQQFRWF